VSGIRPVVVAANWKMNKAGPEVEPYFAAFRRAAPERGSRRVVIFPPFPLLEAVVRAAAGVAEIGAQNCHWEPSGAFTGEVSVPMLAAAGARHVLIGHSERRQIFGESDEDCARKVRAVLAGGLSPMLCVGETIEERDAGRQRAVVIRQLSRALVDLPHEGSERLLIAYEPVWAIGTGRTASPEDAQTMHAAIRETLRTVLGARRSGCVPILYGGSVKPENAAELLARPDIDGALVGGASLSPEAFASIVAASPRRQDRA
jgi:triosephosphate isomerase